jgi:hypothetical protein
LKVLPLARRTQLNRRSFRVLLPCACRVEVLSCALYTRRSLARHRGQAVGLRTRTSLEARHCL